MPLTSRALRTGIVTTTAAAAIALGTASGALAAVPHGAGVTAESGAPTAAKRTYVRTVALAVKGDSAKVYRLGKHAYQAEITDHGKKIADLVALGKAAAADVHGLRVTLSPDGGLTSRRGTHTAVPAHTPRPAARTPGRTAQSTPAPDSSAQPDDQDFDDGGIVGLARLPRTLDPGPMSSGRVA
ncbi:hypothetical protein [Streptomyces sp. cg35]|uniref:hypothetical protein n=1 Tax=Streptomyces sp. cg35 TaxID=3421650 RepID=UPI003D16754B